MQRIRINEAELAVINKKNNNVRFIDGRQRVRKFHV